MKKIETINAVGHILCHDITRIIKDVVKDTAFKKGHIVKEEDIPVLLSLGKEHLYIWEKKEGTLHENEAAEVLYDICKNENMKPSEVKEGKIDLIAETDGLFRIDVKRLDEINELEEIMIAARHNNFPVKKGDKLAGTRVIPLVIEEEKLNEAKKIAGNTPLLELIPYKKMKAGIVTTGSEVYYGRIKDTFTPVVVNKLNEYGITVCGHKIVNDESEMIVNAIKDLKANGADLIICTGGMSVDPDDLTPSSIRESGAEIISYGAPVLPGAMFLLGYFEDETPIMGLPGCVMYSKATIFDLVLPRIAAGVKVTKKDIAKLGNGGLCLGCSPCHYPNCSFGKGV
ncbi:molybdopterin-binding protein [Clostridium sp. C2-6-12]|uniref:molybdopterin-binding protein n=1 Tax=Clostridium sp. C2-6-12 TaxID=2698832 RepID=UPI00136C44BF|nr:molybdopterin-binding protein [Clostridium sp. C2-6-12]